MNLHEYQSKELFNAYGIPVPQGEAVETPEAAARVAQRFGGKAVVKAQIHAGGRGLAGGVRMSGSSEEAAEITDSMLGTRLVTKQTTREGAPVNKVLVEEIVRPAKEIYLGVTIDSANATLSVIASAAGGMGIEETPPELVIKKTGDAMLGFSPYKARDIAIELGMPYKLRGIVQSVILEAVRLFQEKDCSLVEINPLIVTEEDEVIAADAKISVEDDALFRHPDIESMRDPTQLNPLERRAASAGISYVKLEGGSVGCMVNGAGLAMATMDVTLAAGAAPANFLDVGGSTNREKIEEAFRIINADSDVKAILVNLFAGIARADVVAEGVVAAANETGSKMPIVVAMRGTNSEEGRRVFEQSGLGITAASDLEQAASELKKLMEAN